MPSAPGLVPDPPRKDSEPFWGPSGTRVVIRGPAMVLSLAKARSGQLLQKGLGSKAMAEGSSEVRKGVDGKPSTREGLGHLSQDQTVQGKDLGKKSWSSFFRRLLVQGHLDPKN